jgi:hypothetical protein
MCRRHILAAVALALAAAALASAPAAPAHPPAPVDESGHPVRGQIHTWMHQAKVPLVRGRIVVRRVVCPMGPVFAGCVFPARPRVLYLRPWLREPRRILYHELGHTFDLLVLNKRERRRFKRIVGIRRPGWFSGGLPPAEWFADGYASCAVRPRLRRAVRPTPYGYAPTRRRHARVCALIRAAAKPRGRPPEPPRNPPPVIEVPPPPPEQTQPGREPGTCTLFDELTTGCEPTPAPGEPGSPEQPGPPEQQPGPPAPSLPLPFA